MERVDNHVLGRHVLPARRVKLDRPVTLPQPGQAAVAALRRGKAGVGRVRFAPVAGAGDVLVMEMPSQHAVGARRCRRWIVGGRYLAHVGQLHVEEAKPLPVRCDVGLAPAHCRVRQLTVDLREPELFPAGEDRLGHVLPQDGQQRSHCAVALAGVGHRKGYAHHVVAASGQPLDLLHVGLVHRHHWLAVQREPLRQQLLELCGVGQEADRVAGALGGVDAGIALAVGAAPRSRHRSEVSGHEVHHARLKLVRH